MRYTVLRPFRLSDREVAPGEIVDTTGWPFMRPRQLVEQRYLAPLPESTAVPAAPDALPAPSRRRATSPKD
jgi:hypothetical protein